MKTVLLIGRACRFSPHSEAKDEAILREVGRQLSEKGWQTIIINEEEVWPTSLHIDLCLSMGRLPSTLHRLAQWQAEGMRVINNPQGVELCCHRLRLFNLLERQEVSVPPAKGDDGYWLKRGDGVAETCNDVVFADNEKEMLIQQQRMRQRGINKIYVCAHLKGDLLKFYGVEHTHFFSYFYPGDDGQWKFDDEKRNGVPQHYAFNIEQLKALAHRAAELTGIDVYGGDCIVDEKGQISLIDFNDWPSFSRCREEAAKAIAEMLDD